VKTKAFWRYFNAFLIAAIIYALLAFMLFSFKKAPEPAGKKSTYTLNLVQRPQKRLQPPPSKKANEKRSTPSRPKKPRTAKKVPKPKKIAKKERNATKRAKIHPKKARPPQPTPPQTAPSLATIFGRSNTAPKKISLQDLPALYKELYQEDFESFTPSQKRFLKRNLSAIGKITQRYLYLRGYPEIAIRTRQQGRNAVEFWLHPNGDISGLRLIRSSGYEALDANSIETILTAYKDYPRPRTKTKIKIFIDYRLLY